MGHRIRLFDLPVDRLTVKGLLSRVDSAVTSGERTTVMYVNIHCMNVARKEARYHTILNKAGIVYCDGAGVVLGARLLGKELPGRITGADWIYDLCALCVQNGRSLFLFGGEDGVARCAGAELVKRYAGLKIAGTRSGYFTEEEKSGIVEEINGSGADILLVGFGTPLQEYWIEENFEKLDPPVVWAVGAVLDFVAGKVPRAPAWMLDNGLEWLFRLVVEPSRLWKRYVIGNSVFMLRVLNRRVRGIFNGNDSL